MVDQRLQKYKYGDMEMLVYTLWCNIWIDCIKSCVAFDNIVVLCYSVILYDNFANWNTYLMFQNFT